jgi:predicted CXXCH cytochrome family protein
MARAQALIPVAGVLVLVGWCVAQDANQPPKADNPHWNKDRCADCHVQDGAAPRAISVEKVDALCLRCHDGQAATSEIHPIGRSINPKTMNVPGWPLNAGKISCATCHDVKAACAKNTVRPDENMEMLRRPPGRPADAFDTKRGFCLSCHKREQYPRFNPHQMLAADRKPVAEKCLACHKETPATDIARPTGNANLIADQFTLCKSCHPHHEEQLDPRHIGAKVKPEMLAFMRARESVGLAATPGKELIAKLAADKARPTLLRPDDQDVVKCSTCHNPHQAGLFKSGTPAAFGAMRVIDGKFASPVRGEQFCSHCHSDI